MGLYGCFNGAFIILCCNFSLLLQKQLFLYRYILVIIFNGSSLKTFKLYKFHWKMWLNPQAKLIFLCFIITVAKCYVYKGTWSRVKRQPVTADSLIFTLNPDKTRINPTILGAACAWASNSSYSHFVHQSKSQLYLTPHIHTREHGYRNWKEMKFKNWAPMVLEKRLCPMLTSSLRWT